MITLDIKEVTKPQYEVVASNGKEINDIIQEICDECGHEVFLPYDPDAPKILY